MADDKDKRVGALEDELKLLKGEVKRTLVDLRAFIMREDSPLSEKVSLARADSEAKRDQVIVEVGKASKRVGTLEAVSAESNAKMEALEEQIKALAQGGGGGVGPEVTDKIAALEAQIQAIGQGGGGGVGPEVTDKIASLEAQIKAVGQGGGGGVGPEVTDKIAALEAQMKAVGQGGGGIPSEVTDKIASLEAQIRALVQAGANGGSVSGGSVSDGRVDALEGELQSLRRALESGAHGQASISDSRAKGLEEELNSLRRAVQSMPSPQDLPPRGAGEPEVRALQDELSTLRRAVESMPARQAPAAPGLAPMAPGQAPFAPGPAPFASGPAPNYTIQVPFDYIQQVLRPSGAHNAIAAVASAVQQEQPDLRRHVAPDGTVTMLFTDIEGSTAKLDRIGDQRWMEVLHDHNAMVRKEIDAHNGFEVKSLGDGFMVAFSSARRGLQCAVDIQRAFASFNEQHSEEPIPLRLGLHSGEAIQEENDFFGRAVNLAFRIASEAEGGQILVSPLLKELTSDSDEFRFGEGREVELKGLPGRHTVYAVLWNGGQVVSPARAAQPSTRDAEASEAREYAPQKANSGGQSPEQSWGTATRPSGGRPYYPSEAPPPPREQTNGYVLESGWPSPSGASYAAPTTGGTAAPEFFNVNTMANLVR